MLQAVIFDFDGVIADTEKLHLQAFQEVLREHGIELTARDYYERYVGLDDLGVLRAVARDRGSSTARERARAGKESESQLSALLEQKVARYGRLIARSDVLFDGVEERVRAWSEAIPLAIASGALRAEIEMILQRCDLLDAFAAIVTAEDVTRGKPAPEPYLTALERLNDAIRDRSSSGPRAEAAEPRAEAAEPRAEAGEPRAEAGEPRAKARCLRGAKSDRVVVGPGLQPGAGGIRAHNVVVIEDSRPGLEAARAAGMRAVAVTTNCPASHFPVADLVVSSVADLDLRDLVRLVPA